jgi:hypothetical protein
MWEKMQSAARAAFTSSGAGTPEPNSKPKDDSKKGQ